MCDEVVDDYVSALKFVLKWLVTDKVIRKFL